MKIEMGKRYRTKAGQPVRILCTDRKNTKLPVVGLILNQEHKREDVWSWSFDGETSAASYNLTEIGPYDDFKIDDLVMVRDNNSMDWKKRHFAGIREDGLPQSWRDGRTSWTTSDKTEWRQCRRPTEEELNES